MRRLYLASRSPRRIELLSSFGFEVVPCPADIDEEAYSGEPENVVGVLACEKAKAAAKMTVPVPDVPLVAADTLVDLGGMALGKPRDEKEAFSMLKSLSGREHRVHTGICLLFGGKTYNATETTVVTFRTLDDDTILRYIASGEPMDKAGAYGIQGRGGAFAASIRGDYFSVVGLPVSRLAELFNEAGAPPLV